MRTGYDFSPLYRSTVGFDHLFNLLDQANRAEAGPNYPPYNIEKVGDDHYRITMAVAGFSSEEIELSQHQNALIVVGHKKASEDGSQFLHQGISSRAFKQTFDLADHVKVTAANMEHGLLTIELKREVPEDLRPRRVEITRSQSAEGEKPKSKTIEHEARRQDKVA